MSTSRTDLRRRLEPVAFGQAGYFSAAQALSIGYSYQAQKYHVDAGNWVRVDRGIFRLPSWPSSADDDYVRWTLWSGGGAVVSHESALDVHDLSDVAPGHLHLSVAPGFGARDPLVITHLTSVEDIDVEQRPAWRVTTPLRTLADVSAGDLSAELVEAAVSEALDRGLVTRRGILRRAADLSERAALRLERALARHEDR